MSESKAMFKENSFCKHVGNQVEKAIKPLEKDLGVHFSFTKAYHDDNHLTLQIQVSAFNDDGSINTVEADDFKKKAINHGFKVEDVNAPVEIRGKKYVIKGWKKRASKYPVWAEDEKGDNYKLMVNDVLKALGREPSI